MQFNNAPLISVIIPVFNAQKHLVAALETVKRQTIEEIEIIVIDDGSDKKVELPASQNHVLIHHENNRGPAAARNSGVNKARGKYVAFLDADDEWGAGKLEEQVRHMQISSDNVAGVFTPFHYQDAPKKLFNPQLSYENWFDYFLMGCRVAPGSCFLFHRSVFEIVGPQDKDLRHFEDWDWLLRIAKKFNFTHAPSARTILKRSERTRYSLIEKSLQHLERKWTSSLNPKSLKKIQSTINLERAVISVKQSHYRHAFKHLLNAALSSHETIQHNFVWKYTGRTVISAKL